VRNLWQNHHLRSQPELLHAGDQPDFPAKPSARNSDGQRPEGSKDALHQVHPDSGKNSLISNLIPFLAKIAASAAIFVFYRTAERKA
jgi:hypothetical protein